MARAAGYRIIGDGDMITDGPLMSAYAQALRLAVHPGCVVLDIGAGTGIFSLLACQFGAGQVHAVEPDEAIEVARAAAAANGFADRIVFHQALSSSVTLPTPADVIVSDLRGILPLLQHHIPAIRDARQRLLAPGGVLIPRRDRLWAALVEAPKLYRPFAEPWRDNAVGLDLSAGLPRVVNTWCRADAKPEQVLLVEPQCWATLDYCRIEKPDVAGEITWSVERAGRAHGLLLWFDAELADGIGFSNAPGQPELIYGRAFFPLHEPVAVSVGDVVSVTLRADSVDGDYVWRWDTRVTPAGDPSRVKASFRQSMLYAAPISLDKLKRREAGYIPPPAEGAGIDGFVLSRLDGQTSLGEIATELRARFPQRFPRPQDALTRAAHVAQRYTP
jgi:type I protein arginine methyltransferase